MVVYRNSIILQGTLTGLKRLDNVTMGSLKATRIKGKHDYNSVSLSFFDDNKEIIEDHKPGDFIRIEGALRGRQVKSESDRKTQYVAVKKIKKPEGVLNEFGFKNVIPSLAERKNIFCLAGIVESVSLKPEHSLAYIFLSIRDGERTDTVCVKAYTDNAAFDVDKIHKGDNIACAGSINSKAIDGAKGTVYLENFIAKEIAIV